MAGGLSAGDALAVVTSGGDIAYRQLAVVDAAGGSAAYSGRLALGDAADVRAPGAAAAGNLLADRAVPAAMLRIFTERVGDCLGDRLLAALAAGLAAGGEISPVRSVGLLVAESVPGRSLTCGWTGMTTRPPSWPGCGSDDRPVGRGELGWLHLEGQVAVADVEVDVRGRGRLARVGGGDAGRGCTAQHQRGAEGGDGGEGAAVRLQGGHRFCLSEELCGKLACGGLFREPERQGRR